MPTWNPQQYLKFSEQRTQPCRDLVARIDLPNPRRVIDLGCGPGNSVEPLAARWPGADITGLDNSTEMIQAARKSQPGRQWIQGEIGAWASEAGAPFDLVFSNAALQWTPEHGDLFPRLFARVAAGGAFAMQIPGNYDAAPHRLMRQIAASPAWREWFPSGSVNEWHAHDMDFYYDVLAPHAARLDIWATEYLHVLENVEAIVDWYRGTGLRPYLDAIGTEAERQRFLDQYLESLRTAFAPRRDGMVLFPFRRIFLVAYK